MRVRINGEQRDYAERQVTVAEVLRRHHAPRRGVAVEVNRRVVPRAEHDLFALRDGDEVEIVSLVGGG
jgi:thiamine biosynthesis protein ThiS